MRDMLWSHRTADLTLHILYVRRQFNASKQQNVAAINSNGIVPSHLCLKVFKDTSSTECLL
jgi:hypothetical protein